MILSCIEFINHNAILVEPFKRCLKPESRCRSFSKPEMKDFSRRKFYQDSSWQRIPFVPCWETRREIGNKNKEWWHWWPRLLKVFQDTWSLKNNSRITVLRNTKVYGMNLDDQRRLEFWKIKEDDQSSSRSRSRGSDIGRPRRSKRLFQKTTQWF